MLLLIRADLFLLKLAASVMTYSPVSRSPQPGPPACQ